MYLAEIITADDANGPGIRLSIFVSGCTNQCPGCFQPETWDFHYGVPYDGVMEERILTELRKPYYAGLTILGGEPFEPENQMELIHLIRKVRNTFSNRTIWMYTGFVYEFDLIPGGKKHTEVTDEILDNIDVLVDGSFIQEKKNLMLRFRGSENQRIIDMKRTRELKSVVLDPLNDAP